MSPSTSRFGTVRRLPSGRFQVRYSGDGRRQKAPRTFADRSQAQKWLRLKHAEIDSGAVLLAVPDRETVTFAEYAPSQIDGRNIKPRTRVLYQRQLALYLLPVFGRMRLVDITPTMVREWWREFNPQIPTARAHSYSLLKSVLAAAMLEDPPLIDANPCRIRGAGATRRAPHPAGDGRGIGCDRRGHARAAARGGADRRMGRAAPGRDSRFAAVRHRG